MSIESLLVLLLSIPLSILANVLTPKFLDWLAKIYIPIRIKRINNIIKEFSQIRFMRENTINLLGFVFQEFARGICVLVGLIVLIATYLLLQTLENKLSNLWLFVADIVLLVLMLSAANITYLVFFRIMKQMEAVMFFDVYKNHLYDRVQKLGGTIRNLTDTEIGISIERDL